MNTKMIQSNKPVLVFDGTCVLCNHFFQWLVQKDVKQKFNFSTLQSDFGTSLVSGIHQPVNIDSVLLYDHGITYIHSDAVITALKILGGRFAFLGFAMQIFPKFIRNGFYKFIARNRYTWFGTKDCMIPTKEIKSRFI